MVSDDYSWAMEFSAAQHFSARPPHREVEVDLTKDARAWRITRDSPSFTSPVFIDGWSDRSLWGLEDGRFFLALWNNTSPADAAPDLWITGADRVPLHSPGCVVLEVMSHTGIDALTVSAGLNMLPPTCSPGHDLTDEIEQVALTGLSSLNHDSWSDFTFGQVLTYEWILGRSAVAPLSDYIYPSEEPLHRRMVAEWNLVTGLLYRLDPDTHTSLRDHAAGVDSALLTLAGPLRTAFP